MYSLRGLETIERLGRSVNLKKGRIEMNTSLGIHVIGYIFLVSAHSLSFFLSKNSSSDISGGMKEMVIPPLFSCISFFISSYDFVGMVSADIIPTEVHLFLIL